MDKAGNQFSVCLVIPFLTDSLRNELQRKIEELEFVDELVVTRLVDFNVFNKHQVVIMTNDVFDANCTLLGEMEKNLTSTSILVLVVEECNYVCWAQTFQFITNKYLKYSIELIKKIAGM